MPRIFKFYWLPSPWGIHWSKSLFDLSYRNEKIIGERCERETLVIQHLPVYLYVLYCYIEPALAVCTFLIKLT